MTEPRIPREFSDAGIVIRVACRCGHEHHMDPLTIELFYGTDFDLVANAAELVSVIRCEACGSSRPFIFFERPTVTVADDEVPYGEPARAMAGGRAAS